MKVTGVRCVRYEIELNRPIGDANNSMGVQRMANVAVFVDTDEGLQGTAVGHGLVQREVAALSELVVGEDPRAVRGLWQRMLDSIFKYGNQGTWSLAVAALDCALWDLRAKANSVPLWRELGGTSRRVKAYASGLDTPLSDAELRAFYTGMAGRGITAGKLKVGLDPDDDLRRLGLVAEALGGGDRRVSLMVDANEYWSPKQAIRRMAELERHFDIVWCEEPVRRWDAAGLRQVSRGIRAAVASGENLRDVSEFMVLLRHGAVDVVQVGHETTGITGALRVAELADAFDRPVTLMNAPGLFTAHVAAVLPHHLMMEVLGIGRAAVFGYDAVVEDGWIVLGDKPGSGIAFDDEALGRHRADTPRAGTGGFFGRGEHAGVREGPSRRPGE